MIYYDSGFHCHLSLLSSLSLYTCCSIVYLRACNFVLLECASVHVLIIFPTESFFSYDHSVRNRLRSTREECALKESDKVHSFAHSRNKHYGEQETGLPVVFESSRVEPNIDSVEPNRIWNLKK